jgi:multidrug efflux pump subunit AcrA (membrane-fusion protein)
VITAPVAGKVLSVAGVLGSQASAGSTFIVLAGVNDVAVSAQFTEAEVARLATGQRATIALANQPGQQLAGSVIEVDPAGTVSNRLVRYGALIAFANPPASLLYGQSATVVVVTASAQNVLYVPSTAVVDSGGGAGVVVLRAGGKDVRRTVQIGLRGDVYTEIRSGLTEADVVRTVGG